MNIHIEPDNWLRAILSPEESSNKFKIKLPTFPSEKDQRRYTGKIGEDNLVQAFNFYKHVLNSCNLDEMKDPIVLDFGAGWGRIIRFFMRNTHPENLIAIDVMNEAVSLMKATGFSGQIIKCNPLPPVKPGFSKPIDLIYAFSVFSHLSEEYFLAWLTYFRKIISPSGHLVFTSRGIPFLDYMKNVKANHPKSEWPNYLEKMGDLNEVRKNYDKGEFIFYPSAGGDELSSDFFGEAYVSMKYLKTISKDIGFDIVHETYSIPNIMQHIFTLKPV